MLKRLFFSSLTKKQFTKRSAVVGIYILLFLPTIANAGWVYFPPSLNDPAQIPPGGSILCRTYATNTQGVIFPVYTAPFAQDLDGSGLQINLDGSVSQLSVVTPYPPLTPEMQQQPNSIPAIDYVSVGTVITLTLALFVLSYASGLLINVFRGSA